MRMYRQRELRELVRLGVAVDYTNKPSEYIYTLTRPLHRPGLTLRPSRPISRICTPSIPSRPRPAGFASLEGVPDC